MEKNFLLEKVDNAISKYEFMLLKNNMDIKNIDNLFEQYHKKILDIIGREIYNDKNIVAKKNISDENESLLTEVTQNKKDKISVSVIDRILSFYNKTIDVYFNINTLAELQEIEYPMFRDIKDGFDNYYWFSEASEKVIYKIGDLALKKKLKISAEEKELVKKVFEKRQFMVRLILEKKLHIYVLDVDSVYWIGVLTDDIPLQNTTMYVLPKLINQHANEIGSFDEENLVYSIRYYYMYMFQNNKNMFLSDEFLEKIFDSLYTVYYYLGIRIWHEPQEEIQELCEFLLSKVDSSIRSKVKDKAIEILENDILPIRETIENICNL